MQIHCWSMMYMSMSMSITFVTRHIVAIKRIRGADGLPWWSPSQVLTTIYCVCSVCMRVYVRVYCFVRYLISRPILVTSYYFSPVITADITSHSNFLQCHTDHFTSLCAGDHPQSSTAVTHCVLVATHFIDPERMKAWVELVCSGRWTSDLQYDTHEWTCAGVASELTNWASQTDNTV